MRAKTLNCFNTFLKGLISLSVLLSSFSAYSHQVWADDALEVIELIPFKIRGVSSVAEFHQSHIFTVKGFWGGKVHYIHFHKTHGFDDWTTEISADTYNKTKQNKGNASLLMIDFLSFLFVEYGQSAFNSLLLGFFTYCLLSLLKKVDKIEKHLGLKKKS